MHNQPEWSAKELEEIGATLSVSCQSIIAGLEQIASKIDLTEIQEIVKSLPGNSFQCNKKRSLKRSLDSRGFKGFS
jgi:hypothetical protein